MSSKETLPVESNGTSWLPESVEQGVAAHGHGEVFGQNPAEELSGPLRAAHDADPFAVREDRGVRGDRAGHRAHPVQRVTAEEELKIAGPQLQPTHQIALPGQYRRDV